MKDLLAARTALPVSPATRVGSLLRRISSNTLWLTVARIGSMLMMVVLTLAVARQLGEAGLGAYAFVAALVYLGNTISSFGTDMYLFREIAAHRALHLAPAALVLQFAIAVVLAASAAAFAPLVPEASADTIQALRIYSLALVPLAVITVAGAALRGVERMGAYAALTLGLVTLQVAAALLALGPGRGVEDLVTALLIAHLLAAALALALPAILIPGFRWLGRPSRQQLSALVRASAPIALLGVLKVLYQRLGIYMLAIAQGAAATGWYAAALRTVEAAQIGHIVFIGALFPVMAQAHNGQPDQSQSLREKAFLFSWKLLLVLGLGASLLLFFLARPLVEILYGAAFEPAVQALKVLAWLLLPYSANIYLSSQLLAARREREIAVTIGVSLVLLAALNAWLIPELSLIGACLAALGAETAQTILFLRFYLHNSSRPGS